MAQQVAVVIGVGGMGELIARRQGAGRKLVVADFDEQALEDVAERLRGDGFDVTAQAVDVSKRESLQALADIAAGLGDVVKVAHTAGLSPMQAPTPAILAVDLLGVALSLDVFGEVVAPGGAAW